MSFWTETHPETKEVVDHRRRGSPAGGPVRRVCRLGEPVGQRIKNSRPALAHWTGAQQYAGEMELYPHIVTSFFRNYKEEIIMATKKTETQAVSIPAIDIRTAIIKVVGDSPLIMHKWSEKARKEILDKQMKKAKTKGHRP